jgi:uncharacterized BrkB/YihY/UPF0761 family membrane protein
VLSLLQHATNPSENRSCTPTDSLLRGFSTPRLDDTGDWLTYQLAMIVVGIILFPAFLLYEWTVPSKPVMPMRWLRRGPILGACLIGFFDFVSFYLQGTYLYS